MTRDELLAAYLAAQTAYEAADLGPDKQEAWWVLDDARQALERFDMAASA